MKQYYQSWLHFLTKLFICILTITSIGSMQSKFMQLSNNVLAQHANILLADNAQDKEQEETEREIERNKRKAKRYRDEAREAAEDAADAARRRPYYRYGRPYYRGRYYRGYRRYHRPGFGFSIDV